MESTQVNLLAVFLGWKSADGTSYNSREVEAGGLPKIPVGSVILVRKTLSKRFPYECLSLPCQLRESEVSLVHVKEINLEDYL